MSDAKPAPNLSAWALDHLRRYLASDGAEGHHWQSAVAPEYGLMPALLLTLTGRKSGQKYILPLNYGENAGGYFVIASKAGADVHPGWYLNVVANPMVRIQVGSRKFAALARTASGEERKKLWEQMIKRYPPYADYQKKTAREIPVVVLEPVA